jgi:hypothetical protein
MRGEHISVAATYTRKKENENTRGVITMTERNFMFTPNDSRFLNTHKIDVDIRNITVQYGSIKGKDKILMRITVHDSTNKGNYIFELDNSVDGDRCRAYTSKYVGKQPQGTAFSMLEIERKITLLKHNQEECRLHEQLVRGNLIKEDEFWAKRKKLLQAVACEPTAQQTGLASAMLSYIPLISDTECTKQIRDHSADFYRETSCASGVFEEST